MAIDPRIPLMGQQFNLSEIMQNAQTMRMREEALREVERKRQAEQEKAASLSDLIASRGPDGSYDTRGPAFQRFTQADPANAFEMLGKLDERQRKAVEAGTKDLAAAVQWADTPDKWAVVQRHIAQFDPQLAQTPFEAREQALVQLGQMGAYLEKTAPKIMSIEAGGSLAAVDPRTGQPTFTVLPNPGGATPGAPAASGGQSGGSLPRVSSPQEALKLPPGSQFLLPDGRIGTVPGGGGGARVTSNFLDGL